MRGFIFNGVFCTSYVEGITMTWRTDISAAMRGTDITKTVKTAKGEHEVTQFVPDQVWLALAGGEVIKSYWIPPIQKHLGRWHACGITQTPIAWQPFVKPEFPAELDMK
jgi:hypothetical protein